MACFVPSAPVQNSTIPERRLEPDWWWAKRIRYIRKEVTGPIGNTIGLYKPLFDDAGFRTARRCEAASPVFSTTGRRKERKMMQVNEFQEILYSKDDSGIVTITLNIPKRKNAFSKYTTYELFWAMEALEKDETAHALIITGARDPDSDDPTKEAFCSGGYFHPNAMAPASEEARAEIDMTDIAEARMTLKMWQCDKPIIAAVNGLFIGGGFTMCLTCFDLVYCSEHAWAQLPFIRLGIVPEVASSYMLPRLIGFQRAKEIMFFGERLPAQKLLELGLVNRVLPHDRLMDCARETALRLIPPAGAGYAVRMTKRILHRPLIDALTTALNLENKGLNEAFTTADFSEALAARREKRPPKFQGK